MQKWTERHEHYLSEVILPVERKLKEIMVGQDNVVRRVVQGLFAVGQRDLNAQTGEKFLGSGHVLCEGPVGTGKTVLCKSLSRLLDGDNGRVSGMPDALASDITGCEIILLTGESKTVKGPVFCNVMLADEINRFPPKAQTAFVEALAEGTVTIGGTTYRLKEPFFCLATQNPTEQKGTSRLQEALSDRFMFKLILKESTVAEMSAIAQKTRLSDFHFLQPIIDSKTAQEARLFFFDKNNFYVSEFISDCCAKLISAINHPADYGLFVDEMELMKFLNSRSIFKQTPAVNNRGVLHLEGAAMIEAVWHRRNYVLPTDIYNVAKDVLRARLMIAETGLHALLKHFHSKYQTETELSEFLLNDLLSKVVLP